MKTFARIAIVGSIYLFLESGYQLDRGRPEFEELIKYAVVLVTTISIVFYVRSTKFGVRDQIELDRLNRENSILKLKIENKILQDKLDNKFTQ